MIILWLLTTTAFAGGPIQIIGADDPIPTDRFIFMIMNVDSGEVVLGYSKKEHDINSPHPKGVRNGGHVALLAHALEIEGPTYEKIVAKSDRRWIGGGFYKDSNGFTYLHPFSSNNAVGLVPSQGKAGQLSSVVNGFFMNGVNGAHPSRFIPEGYSVEFYSVIQELTEQPLRVDEDFFYSKRMPFNFEANLMGDSQYTREYFRERLYWFESSVEEANLAGVSAVKKLNTQCLLKNVKEVD
jgi:hypothetical protein